MSVLFLYILRHRRPIFAVGESESSVFYILCSEYRIEIVSCISSLFSHSLFYLYIIMQKTTDRDRECGLRSMVCGRVSGLKKPELYGGRGARNGDCDDPFHKGQRSFRFEFGPSLFHLHEVLPKETQTAMQPYS